MAKKQFHNVNFSDPYQEIALVKGLIYMPECITMVQRLFPDSSVFQHEAIRSVYDCLCELYLDNGDVDEMSLQFHITKTGKKRDLDKSGMNLKFDEMTPSSVEGVQSAAEGLLSLYRRQLAYNVNIQMNAALDSSVSDKELSDRVLSLYEALTLKGGANLEKNSKQACDEAMEDIEKAMKAKSSGKTAGIPTGSDKLDRELGGWMPDDVIGIMARPGGLKTGVGLDFAKAAAEMGFPVGIISVEMDAKELKKRMVSMDTKIPYRDMRRGTIDHHQFTLIQTAASRIAKLPIYYYDDASISNVDVMEIVVTEWARKYGIKLILIDYLQYMTKGKSLNLREDITAVSKAIKSINRKLRIPIIELLQMSREVESRGDKGDAKPKMKDAREAGQIEQDASIMIGLYYPDSLIRDGKTDIVNEFSSPPGQPFAPNAFRYYILKSRSGSHFVVDRFVDPATNRFSDTDIFSTPVEVQKQIDHGFRTNEVFKQVKVPF